MPADQVQGRRILGTLLMLSGRMFRAVERKQWTKASQQLPCLAGPQGGTKEDCIHASLEHAVNYNKGIRRRPNFCESERIMDIMDELEKPWCIKLKPTAASTAEAAEERPASKAICWLALHAHRDVSAIVLGRRGAPRTGWITLAAGAAPL